MRAYGPARGVGGTLGAHLAEGDVPLWQLGVAILTTLVAAVLLVRLAAQVHERTLLQTGRRITFGEALRSRSDV